MRKLKGLSIVTTLYNSGPYIEEFYQNACKYASAVTDDFEIIFVNDSSPDDSLTKAISLFEKHDNIKVIDLARNFGQHKAMMTGLRHADKDYVFNIDSDLEESLEWMVNFKDEMERTGADVVYGVQKRRKGGLWERITGAIYYKIHNMICHVKIPENFTNCRLMNRRFVNALLLHKESEFFLAGIFSIAGFHKVPLLVNKVSTSTSNYTFRKKIEMLFNGITSFSAVPLYFVFYSSLFLLSVSLFFLLYKLIMKSFFNSILPGYTSIIISIWFFGSFILFAIGVLSIYISKIYIEVKNRPFTITKSVYKK